MSECVFTACIPISYLSDTQLAFIYRNTYLRIWPLRVTEVIIHINQSCYLTFGGGWCGVNSDDSNLHATYWGKNTCALFAEKDVMDHLRRQGKRGFVNKRQSCKSE